MAHILLLLNVTGGLCMFLFGMKVMSDGLQQSAGDRMRKTLNLMTANRFSGLLMGLAGTSIIQSSTACIVIIVSFVNAGLLTLTQSIGVVFGANVGTTVTGWIVSILGFNLNISNLALPAVGIGFILSVTRRYKTLGSVTMGFGLLFLGLFFLTTAMANIHEVVSFDFMAAFRDRGYLAILIGVCVGLLITVLTNSSSLSVAIIMTMAFNDLVTYEMAAGMILGTNIGTTSTTVLAAIGANTAAKQVALAHVLFNVIGAAWSIPLLLYLLALVGMILPGDPWAVLFSAEGARIGNAAIPIHLAGLHTLYKIINTALFLPFTPQFARLIMFLLPEKESEEKSGKYEFLYSPTATTDPQEVEVTILRVEKEIRDMAGIVSSMYNCFSVLLRELPETDDKKSVVSQLSAELKPRETRADQMRGALTGFLIECMRERPKPGIEQRISRLLRIIGNIEEMSDECYSISRVLETAVYKDRLFKRRKTDELIPFVDQVGELLALLEEQLGQKPTAELTAHAKALEASIIESRKQLWRLSNERIEIGRNVTSELVFIDLARRIERLSDYCFSIAEVISSPDLI